MMFAEEERKKHGFPGSVIVLLLVYKQRATKPPNSLAKAGKVSCSFFVVDWKKDMTIDRKTSC